MGPGEMRSVLTAWCTVAMKPLLSKTPSVPGQDSAAPSRPRSSQATFHVNRYSSLASVVSIASFATNARDAIDAPGGPTRLTIR